MRYVLLVPVWALFAACTAVRNVKPAELSPPHAPTRVWATLPDNAVLVLDSASVRGDTLIGKVSGEEKRLILSEGPALQAREPSPSRTVILVTVAGGAVVAGSWYLLKETSVPYPCGGGACVAFLEADSQDTPTCRCC